MNKLDSAHLPLYGKHLIEASAGTGKTHNIVRIYLRLLLEKELTVDTILVMTFTVAATGELRKRLNEFLRTTLNHWDDINSEDEALLQTLHTAIEPAKAKLLLRQAILQLDQAAIYTIHGFCKRALSQQAFFSGLSFNANMDAQSDELLSNACEDWYRIQQKQTDFFRLAERWPTPDTYLEHWREVLITDTQLVRPELPDPLALAKQLQQAWPTEQEALLKLNKPRSDDVKQLLAQVEQQLTSIAETPERGLEIQFDQQVLKKFFNTEKKQQQLPAAYQLIKAWLIIEKAKQINLALDGVEFVRAQVKRDKHQLDQLDFNDLITGLRDALQGDNAELLRAAMLEQFPATLVDEFQDTDPDQYQILHCLYGNQPEAFLCMIGDPKQAIYSFRGGDIFAYLKAKEDVDYQWTMDTNYRSTPAVINGYNQAFLQNDSDENSTLFRFGIGYHRINASDNKTDAIFSDNTAAVQWRHFIPQEPEDKGEKKSFQHIIACWVAQEIVNLLTQVTMDEQQIKTSDIAVLVRNYSEASLLQQYLSNSGLASVYLSTRENIFQTEEAFSLQQLLAGIWQPDNDRKFIAALASSWIGMKVQQLDDINHNEHRWAKWQNQFLSWREQWQQKGLMSVLMEVLQQHYQPYSEAQERSLTNRLHLAERLQMESNQHRQPDALLHWFDQALQESIGSDENLLRLESDEALIKIVTMHGAKGLEYPIVFLPFISYYAANNRERAVYRYHDRQDYSLKLSFLASDEEKKWTAEEEQAEFIRLLYVAMTRAEKRLYACMAPFKGFNQSPLGQLLDAKKYDLEDFAEKLTIANQAELIAVPETQVIETYWSEKETQQKASPARFHGHIERDWWLSSFSALTRHAGHSVRSTPDRDEDEIPETPTANLPLRFRLAKGAEAGNLLHDTLERCDFSAPDFDTLQTFAVERYANLAETFTPEQWQQWLNEILQTRFHGQTTLADLPLPSTLRESEFYFPMHGRPITELAAFISKRRGEAYRLPEYHQLKGMMHGFIDLIFEINGQYFVADYKSNHLGENLSDYSTEAIQQNIFDHHYDVQYSLYSLALHRFLKSRLPNYDPQTHLGGVYYFYLRGMHPEHSGGVYSDSFSSAELQQLDQIFAEEQSI
jgi:exodeoxyribonuclease V beta subunit